MLFLVLLSMGNLRCEIPCNSKEVLRETSPDKKVDFVLNLFDCGATTSGAWHVFIVPVGGDTKNAKPVFVADHMRDEEIRWTAPRMLEITYSEARIYQFTNFWQLPDSNNIDYVVHITEMKRRR